MNSFMSVIKLQNKNKTNTENCRPKQSIKLYLKNNTIMHKAAVQ